MTGAAVRIAGDIPVTSASDSPFSHLFRSRLLFVEILIANQSRQSPAVKTKKLNWIFCNRSQGCKVRCASNQLIVSVYRVPQMQGVGRAGVLLYFKCPTTKRMRCPVNAYYFFVNR
jgi:hypothetical protein